jgi:poly(hydroxyalkanoate) granule-associated protein
MSSDRLAMPAEMVGGVQRLWLAGLGVFVLARQESVKLADGTSRFLKLLLEKGQEMEDDGVSPAGGAAAARQRVEKAWATVEAMFDARVASALTRLGVPTRDELSSLTRRIEHLMASIEALKDERRP